MISTYIPNLAVIKALFVTIHDIVYFKSKKVLNQDRLHGKFIEFLYLYMTEISLHLVLKQTQN